MQCGADQPLCCRQVSSYRIDSLRLSRLLESAHARYHAPAPLTVEEVSPCWAIHLAGFRSHSTLLVADRNNHGGVAIGPRQRSPDAASRHFAGGDVIDQSRFDLSFGEVVNGLVRVRPLIVMRTARRVRLSRSGPNLPGFSDVSLMTAPEAASAAVSLLRSNRFGPLSSFRSYRPSRSSL
jgi:hypothetical protein